MTRYLVVLGMAARLAAQTGQTVVVTGTYDPIPLGESDRSLHVVKVMPLLANSVADLFRQDASVDLESRAPGGVQGDISIRGATFGQTLVLLNGLRLNDAQSAHHNLDIPVPVEAIGQMEVLRGAGSTEYGADAVGGVVNFVTRRPERWEARARGGLGSFGETEEQATAGGEMWGVGELVSVTRDASKGFRNDRDYRNLGLSSISMGRDALGAATVVLGLTDKPFGADQFYGNYDSWERTKGWFAGAHQEWGTKTELEFGFRRHTDLFVLYRERPQVYTNRHADETWQGAVRRTDDLPLGAKLHSGVEVDADSIESNNLGYHSRTLEGVYLSYDARVLRRFSVSAGVRDDIYNGGRNAVSPNVSGAAWLGHEVKVRAAVSRAFRLPTYTDLYYQDPATRGNANLKAETAWNYEGGVDWRWLGVTVFDRRDRNVIDYVQSTPGAYFVATNFQKLAFLGVEAAAKWRGFEARYTRLQGDRSLQPGLVSRYVFRYPVHSGVAMWQGRLPGGFVARTRVGALQRVGQGAYGVWDAYGAWERGHVHPFLQVTNLTGTGYQEVVGVVQPGRSVLGGIEVVWRGR